MSDVNSDPSTPPPAPTHHAAAPHSARPLRIGVIGGGQLARMMYPAAIELGVELHVLATSAEESAAQVIANVTVGRHDDEAAVRAFARTVDVVTVEHEHVPTQILRALQMEGVAVRPGPHALAYAQDKLLMRERLSALGYPCPRWWRITGSDDLRCALNAADQTLILKTARGGYDGKGVMVVRRMRDAQAWLERGEDLLAEEYVPFTRELCAQVARRPGGHMQPYPVVESEQRDGVCFRVQAPAPGLTDAAHTRIRDIAQGIARDLDVVGMLAVEMFEHADGSVSVNELAMRPHNTGHWSMDGCVTSQFEQHVRAVADLPLGDTRPLDNGSVMINLLGASRRHLPEGAAEAMRQEPRAKIHLYGKTVSPGRKVGHVTIVGGLAHDTEAALAAADTIVNGE